MGSRKKDGTLTATRTPHTDGVKPPTLPTGAGLPRTPGRCRSCANQEGQLLQLRTELAIVARMIAGMNQDRVRAWHHKRLQNLRDSIAESQELLDRHKESEH
jgi:hypothetical protein